MRRTAATLLLSCLLAASALIAAPPASACSCVPQTTAQHLERADAVFTARLVSREEFRGSVLGGADAALHVFAVDTVVKGTAHREQGVLSPASGASCGLELVGDGPFVVFATRSADLGGGDPLPTLADGQYAALLCGGTGPATPGLLAELDALAPAAATPAPLPGSAGTTPAGPGRVVPTVAGAGALALLGIGALLVLRRRRSSPARPRR